MAYFIPHIDNFPNKTPSASMEILNTDVDCTIVSSRIFDASIEKLFKAWTDPMHLKNWWGPKGFSNTFYEYDLQVGGRWRFVMHGPDKGNYENECEFLKIEEPNLIAWLRITKPIFQVVATFESQEENKTKVTFNMIFNTAEECEKLRKYVPDKNEENFDRLEMELLNIQA